MSRSASFAGACEACPDGIRPGQQIQRVGETVAGWMHVVCPTPMPACPDCFVIVPLSGVCASCGWTVGS